MAWIIAIIVLCVIYNITTNIKDVIGNILDGNSILAKLTMATFILTVASWFLHFIIAPQLMLGLSKVLISVAVVLIVIRLISLIFKRN